MGGQPGWKVVEGNPEVQLLDGWPKAAIVLSEASTSQLCACVGLCGWGEMQEINFLWWD